MSEKQKFQEIIQEIRSDLQLLKELHSKLRVEFFVDIVSGGYNDSQLLENAKAWIYDTYIDKFFETNAKIIKLLSDLRFEPTESLVSYADLVTQKIEQIALNLDFLRIISADKKMGKKIEDDFGNEMAVINLGISQYQKAFERAIVEVRRCLYQTGWSQVKPLKIEDYVLPTQRKKYVTAREELEKAKQAAKNELWEDVLNHLRPAIELALMEKFGFKKIHPMLGFIQCAEMENFPLPSYILVYEYYAEGNKRIHGGKLNTPFECQKALEFVAGFIDQLDLIDVKKERIEEFKHKCKWVE